MSTKSAGQLAAFAAGFAWLVDHHPMCLIREPLTTALFGSLAGAVATMGLNIVQSLIPPSARWVVPSLLTVSTVYHLLPLRRQRVVAAPVAAAPGVVMN